MKNFLAILTLTLSVSAMAQGSACNTAAADKKLTGAAKATFVQKCEAQTTGKLVLVSKEKKYSVAPTSSYGQCEHSASDL